MLEYVLRRLAYLILTAFGLTFLVFLLMQLVPGSVVDQMIDLQGAPNAQRVEELRRFFGLDQPWYVQYGRWVLQVLSGELGQSWRTGLPIRRLLGDALLVTVELALLSTIFSVIIGVPLGIVAGLFRGSVIDRLARTVSLAGLSVPVFWQGTMLILVLSLYLKWSPPMRWISPFDDLGGNFKLMLLPAATLGTASAAALVRMTRTTLLEVLDREYVLVARSKGLSETIVLTRHALRNALIPVITVIGLQMAYLFGGAVVVEEVFSLPGLGRLLLQAITQRDFPLLQAAALFIAFLFMITNLLVDLLYAVVDPRIRYT